MKTYEEIKEKLSLFNGLYDYIRIFDYENAAIVFFNEEGMERERIKYLNEQGFKKYNDIDRENNISMEDIKGNKHLVITTVVSVDKKWYVVDLIKKMKNKNICMHSEKKCQEIINKLNKKISEDELTQIYNRSHIQQNMQNDINNTDFSKHLLYVAMCDVNKFKNVNDEYGHIVGDEVLRQCTGIIEDMLPNKECWVGRYGGDEFIIFIKADKKFNINDLVNEIKKSISDNVVYCDNSMVRVSMSIGIKEIHNNYEVCKDVIREADKEMY